MKRCAVLVALPWALAGCASAPADDVPRPATVRVAASDFCEIMRGVAPPTGKLSWSVRDTPETITGIRRLAAAVDRRCSPANPQPTS